MELNKKGLENREQWQKAGYKLPEFNRDRVEAKTKENPFWVHFGAGNIFRAFQANVVQRLLDEGVLERGLVVVDGYDYEIVEKMYRPHDGYTILVTLKADGTVEKKVIGSIVESCILDSENSAEYDRLKGIFAKESLQMATFTITEKGYSLVDGKGNTLPAVNRDYSAGPEKPESYMGKVASLLYHRYLRGKRPIAMVSMDNCSHNGDKFYGAMNSFAQEWCKRGLAEPGFLEYINNRSKVTFPWTMIDKITPRPDVSVEEILKKDGIEGIAPVVTTKNTHVAPFVNAEECEYLVIEDVFPNGRPELEKGGIMFTDRETVDKVEKMKVCTCLNPLHTALAIFGCLLGYTKISEEMKDPELKKLIELVGYKEGLPVVVNPEIIDPKKFIDTVINVRFPNPFMPDTPQRIATDTSQKLAIRFGETIKAYNAAPDKDVSELKLIPLVFAGWLRYLMGIDDEGNEFEISPDPLLDTLRPYVEEFKECLAAGCKGHGIMGGKTDENEVENEIENALRPILSNEDIFGVSLYDVGIAPKVCGYFAEMQDGKGAVRRTLKKYTS